MQFEVQHDIIRGITDMVWIPAGKYPVKRMLEGKVIILLSKSGPRNGPRPQTTIVNMSEGVLTLGPRRVKL